MAESCKQGYKSIVIDAGLPARDECYLRSRCEPLTWTTGSRAHFPQQAGRDHRNPLGGPVKNTRPRWRTGVMLVKMRDADRYGSGAGTFSVRDYRRRSDLCAA